MKRRRATFKKRGYGLSLAPVSLGLPSMWPWPLRPAALQGSGAGRDRSPLETATPNGSAK